MKRRLFNILSALSLLLCVAMVVLWVLNIWMGMMWSYHGNSGVAYWVYSEHGNIAVDYMAKIDGMPWAGFHELPTDSRINSRGTHLGFELHIVTGLSAFVIPDWFICSVTAVLPYLWYRSYRQRRLAERKGLCPKCGYDLRASKDRCPECGTPVTAVTL